MGLVLWHHLPRTFFSAFLLSEKKSLPSSPDDILRIKMENVKLWQKGYCLNHSCDLQHWHIFTCNCCASLGAINNLPAKYEEKAQHPPVLGPVAVRAHTNALTKGCERHKSVHEPFVVSLTPTTNHFLHPSPPLQWMFSTTPNTSVHFWHSQDELQTVPVFGVSPGCVGGSATCSVWRRRADESQAVVRKQTLHITMQLWEPSLTIWWHLVELFVSIRLFNLIYACLRKKFIYVYYPNGIWICAMDKYLRPGWKAIRQDYDGFSGCGWLHHDFLNRMVYRNRNRVQVEEILIVSSFSVYVRVMSLCLYRFGWAITQSAAIEDTLNSGHASTKFKLNAASHFIHHWTWSTSHYIRMLSETGARQQAEVQWAWGRNILG